MKTLSPPMRPLKSNSPSSGVALVITLLMMSVLVMMVVGLAGVMRNEQAAARNLTYQVVAEQMAEMGVKQAMADVLSNSIGSDAGSLRATGPGWMLAGGTIRPLFCSNPATEGSVNLETWTTNSLILSVPTNASGNPVAGNLSASWSNVHTGNPKLPFGRYAWWTDDEGGKLNLNYTGPGNSRIVPWASAFPFSANYAFMDPVTGSMNSASLDRASAVEKRLQYFFTPESLKDTNVTGNLGANNIGTSVYPRLKGHVTAWSSNVNLNPYGQVKYSLANLTNAAVITNNTQFEDLCRATFENPNLKSNNLVTFSQDFAEKYGGGNPAIGRLILRQAMASAYEALQPTNSTAPPISDASGTNLPANFLGLSPRSILCNEVGVGASVNINPTDNTLQIQVWVVPELITAGKNDLLFENTRTVFTVKNNGIRVVSAKAGGKTISGFGSFYSTTIVTNAPARRSGTITNSGFFTNRTWACFEYTWGPGRGSGPADLINNAGKTTDLQLAVDIPDIVVQQKFGANFAVADWYFSGGTVTLTYPGDIVVNNNGRVPNPSFPASQPSTPDVPQGVQFQGRSKSDPRSRAFTGWSNSVKWSDVLWISKNSTLGLLNQGFPDSNVKLPGGLKPDRLKSSGFTFSNDAKAWSPGTNLFWPSNNPGTPVPVWSDDGTDRLPGVGLLGFIHTGLPWRTFRLSAQEGDPDPPDWLLVDLFSAYPGTNSVPAINLNTQYQALTNGSVTNRLPMVLNLLNSLTNKTTDANPPLPLWTNVWAATNLNSNSPAFANLHRNFSDASRWIPGSWWASKRQSGSGPATNPALFLFGGELAEIQGIGNVGTSDEDREAPLVAAGDLIATRSDTFSVWSVGQGLVVVTNASGNPVRTNIMGEVRKQSVFQRIPQFDGATNLTGYKLKLLYTRNHVVE